MLLVFAVIATGSILRLFAFSLGVNKVVWAPDFIEGFTLLLAGLKLVRELNLLNAVEFAH